MKHFPITFLLFPPTAFNQLAPDDLFFLLKMSLSHASSISSTTSAEHTSLPWEIQRRNDAAHARQYVAYQAGRADPSSAYRPNRTDKNLALTEYNITLADLNNSFRPPRPTFPDHSVGGFWSEKAWNAFVVTGGRFEVGQGLEIKDQDFWVEGWGGCGSDFVALRIRREGARGLLVVPDSFSWRCPRHYSCLAFLLRFLGLASSSCQARFGLPPVSPFNPYPSMTQLSRSHSILSLHVTQSSTAQPSTTTFTASSAETNVSFFDF